MVKKLNSLNKYLTPSRLFAKAKNNTLVVYKLLLVLMKEQVKYIKLLLLVWPQI